MPGTCRPTACLAAILLAWLAAPGTAAQDAYLASVDVPRFLPVGRNVFIHGKVGNRDPMALTGFTVAWRWEQGEVFRARKVTMGGAGLMGANITPFTHNVPFGLVGPGSGTLHFWVEGDGDTDRSNDTVHIAITALERWTPKNLLMELRTSLHDGVCEAQRPFVDWLASDDRLVLARCHHDDPFAVPAVDQAFEAYGPEGLPACVLDAGEYGGYAVNNIPGQWQDQIAGRIQGVSPVLLWTTVDMGPADRQVDVTINIRFLEPLQGPFRVKALVLLNDVPVPGPEGTAVYHHQVARGSLGAPEGQDGALPMEPDTRTTYQLRYRFDLPGELDPDKVCIAASVLHVSERGLFALNASAAGLRSIAAPVFGEAGQGPKEAPPVRNRTGVALLPKRLIVERPARV